MLKIDALIKFTFAGRRVATAGLITKQVNITVRRRIKLSTANRPVKCGRLDMRSLLIHKNQNEREIDRGRLRVALALKFYEFLIHSICSALISLMGFEQMDKS